MGAIGFESGCLGLDGPLNPPILGDFELGWFGRWGCGGDRLPITYISSDLNHLLLRD
jgi:hypothetical protein